jgi:2,4-dienoyl-CoA reductase-like NADH-dependent reductase (Old Yellow Enzyme family)
MLGDLSLCNRVGMAPLTRTRAEKTRGDMPTNLLRQYDGQSALDRLI